MTDLHCHILHDIDDGPPDLDGSLELCLIACSNRIDRIAATPHIADLQKAADFLAKRDKKLEELNRARKERDLKVDVLPGAEVCISAQIFDTATLSQLTINHSRYLLAEFPQYALHSLDMNRYMVEIQSHGLVPIIAHPERYSFFQQNYGMLNTLMQKGVLFQVNVSSLCAPKNKAQYSLAWQMVRMKAVSFLATDGHTADARPNNLLEMLNSLPYHIDFDYLDALVNENPNLVLQDRVLDTSGRRPLKPKPALLHIPFSSKTPDVE